MTSRPEGRDTGLGAGEAELLETLGGLKPGTPAVVLVRHAEREPIPPGERGDHVPLTEAGRARARALGLALTRAGRPPSMIRSSPVHRCMDTALCLARGCMDPRDCANQPVRVEPDTMLGSPGVFVADLEVTWRSWFCLGRDEFMGRVMRGQDVDGLHPDPSARARLLVSHMLGQGPGGLLAVKPVDLGVHVTHDVVLAGVVALLMGEALDRDGWPGFLEGMVLWREGGAVWLAYKGRQRIIEGL